MRDAMNEPIKKLMKIVCDGKSLTAPEAQTAAELILGDTLTSEEISGFLIALKTKKESSDEIEGFLAAIRATTKAFPPLSEFVPIAPPQKISYTRTGLVEKFSPKVLVDVCGTGGDGTHTFNVSTGVAILLASMGLNIAKHGNRSVSSASGSSDVLQALGIKSDTTPDEAAKSLASRHVSFLHAPAFYPVLAKIAPIRKSIGTHTIFNILGPLLNPAPITHQLMGVYDRALLQPAADAIRTRGIKNAILVHGSDGLDELTLSGETHGIRIEGNYVMPITFTPEAFGLKRAPLSDVQGGTPAENAEILMKIYAGEKSPKRDLLVMNAAAVLILVEGFVNYKIAVDKIEDAIKSGITLKFIKDLQAANS
jgi:anthranilate phosphoribosyltransferase